VIREGQTLIKTKELAALLDVHPDTISRWRCTKLRDALFSRGRFKVPVLRAMGLLPQPETQPEIIPHA
jgi:hypothetical protein